MIGSRLSLFLFTLLRNDKVWQLLSEEEKEIVNQNNDRHNNVRDDYANPEKYSAGNSFDREDDRTLSVRGNHLQSFLDNTNPKTILEVGPGSGYYTRQIVNHTSVTHYTGTDINNAFLQFLEPRLKDTQKHKPDFSFNLIHGDFNTLAQMDLKFDAIILLSTVHHIPDRFTLFKRLENLLTSTGKIITMEPCHYIPRRLYLFKKFFRTYNKPAHYKNPGNYGTHHFCTIEEYKRVIKTTQSLVISKHHFYRINFPFPVIIRKIISKFLTWLNIHPVKMPGQSENNTFETSNPRSLLHYFGKSVV